LRCSARRGLALEYELGDMGGTACALGTLGFLADPDAVSGAPRRARPAAETGAGNRCLMWTLAKR
jgi:hypothetical protein